MLYTFTLPVLGYQGILYFTSVTLSYVYTKSCIRQLSLKHLSDYLAVFIGSVGIWITLLSAFLIPLDTFFVSFLKYDNGTFKEWVTHTIEQDNFDFYMGYYVFQGLALVFIIFLMPFLYFLYENITIPHKRNALLKSFAYAFALSFVGFILLAIGSALPYNELEIETGIKSMNKLSEGFFFLVNLAQLVGIFGLLFYTATGIPLFIIDSLLSFRRKDEIEEKHLSSALYLTGRESIRMFLMEDDFEQNNLKAKKNVFDTEQEESAKVEKEEHFRHSILSTMSSRVLQKKIKFFKIFSTTIIGLIALVTALTMCVSLIMVNVDRARKSKGIAYGYLMDVPNVFSPLDTIMINCQSVLCLDSLLYLIFMMFLVSSTIFGFKFFGIRTFKKKFAIEPHKSKAQSLLVSSTILMCIILSFNRFLMFIMPYYINFGSQNYGSPRDLYLSNCSDLNFDETCLHSVLSTQTVTYTLQFPVFSILHYWFSWLFLVSIIVGIIVKFFDFKKQFRFIRSQRQPSITSDRGSLLSSVKSVNSKNGTNEGVSHT